MPHFFFNYISGGTTAVDDTGTEFSSLEAAYLDTCETALAIAFEKLRERVDPADDAFEITDHKQTVLMRVPFSEVLQPAAAKHVAAITKKAFLALDNCHREAVRGGKLKDEIRTEFAKARELVGTIRATCSLSLSRGPPFKAGSF